MQLESVNLSSVRDIFSSKISTEKKREKEKKKKRKRKKEKRGKRREKRSSLRICKRVFFP